MKMIKNNTQYNIEFKHITGQDFLEAVRRLFLEYAESLKIDLSFQNFYEELNLLPGKYKTPEGDIILAFINGDAAGCIALRKSSENICEMKRLYVREAYRNLHLGRILINMIIEEGKKLNYRLMRLDTLDTLKSALHLYESFGFYDIDSYIYNPLDGARYMELKLK